MYFATEKRQQTGNGKSSARQQKMWSENTNGDQFVVQNDLNVTYNGEKVKYQTWKGNTAEQKNRNIIKFYPKVKELKGKNKANIK